MVDPTILMLTTEYPPAKGYGLARYTSELAVALTGLGAEVHVVTCNVNGSIPGYVKDGVNVWDRREGMPVKHYNWVGDAVLNNVYLTERAMQVADENRPFDVILSHDWLSAHSAKSLRSILGVPWVLFMHDTEVGKRDNRLVREQAYIAEMEGWALEQADRIICCSDFLKTELRDRYGCPSDAIEVVPCGVNPSSFEVEAAFPHFRRLFAPDDAKIILFVGRLAHVKGPDLLLEAAARLLGVREDVRVLFCGDGPMKHALQARAVELGVQDDVGFTGYVGSQVLAALYRVSDLLVVPSRYEPFGMVALEGAVCGLPIVVSGAGGLREIANNVDAVRVVQADDAENMANACLTAFDHAGSVDSDLPHDLIPPPAAYEWPRAAERTLAVVRAAREGLPA